MDKNMERSRVISAAEFAALSDINNLTADRIEALVGGHGMLNLSVYTVANVIIEELNNGGHLDVKNANATKLPMEDILQKCIDVCKKGGCDAANAALISAVMMYLAGSAAQVGIPAGNRKLGALARLLAGADRCGVSNIPTAKTNNKLSGFPAVAAIYRAMEEGTLTEIDGRNIPLPVAGSAFYGHGSLGEDYVYPQLAENGARVGTEAMMRAYIGSGMRPQPFACALFGAAAILEIVHPDAEVSEELGPYGKFNSAMLAGRTAAKTAGLPDKIHVRGTNEEYDTGRFIGDLGLILKDVGGPSVIGMMALNEIIALFKENLAGSSGGFTNSPLGHICGYGAVMMKAILFYEGDKEAAMNAVVEDRKATNMNPEFALSSINITARKAEVIHRGPVTDMLIQCTEPARFESIHRRCEYAYDMISSGMDVAEVVHNLETQKLRDVERNAGLIFSKMFGEECSVKVLNIRPAARRTKSKLACKYLSFDGYFDVEVTRGDKHVVLEGLSNNVIPKVVKGEYGEDVSWALPIACPVCADQLLSGCHIENVILPAAISALLGQHLPDEAAEIAEAAAYITASIPGCKAPAKKVANLAVKIGKGF